MAVSTIRVKTGHAVVIMATALALVLGLFAAPADAAISSMTARLAYSRGFDGRYTVRVTGVVRMPGSEARKLIATGHDVVWRLWGEDPVADDLLAGPLPATVTTFAGVGLRFTGSVVLTGAELNEDAAHAPFDEIDDLYAGVRLVNSRSQTVRSVESNRVRGRF